MPNALLDTTRLSAIYATQSGPVTVLADVSLRLAERERLGIIGRSGSGKSTLARLLCGLPLPGALAEGVLSWSGAAVPVNQARRAGWSKLVAYLPQDAQAALHPMLRVRTQIAETLRAAGQPSDRAAIERCLADVSCRPELADRFPHQISGGQAQRVALACCLAQQPQLLVVDEPTSALDVSTKQDIVDLLATVTRSLALVVVSHDVDVVRLLCRHVVVLDHGRLVEQGSARAVLDTPRSEAARRLLTAHEAMDQRVAC